MCWNFALIGNDAQFREKNKISLSGRSTNPLYIIFVDVGTQLLALCDLLSVDAEMDDCA